MILEFRYFFNLSDFLFFKTTQKNEVGTRFGNVAKVLILEKNVLTARILHFMRIK